VGGEFGDTNNDEKGKNMNNHLANETSPYLLQHASNPIDWYPWVEEAFAKAKRENKPIFLSTGYSTCHWCHRGVEFSEPDYRCFTKTKIISTWTSVERNDIASGIRTIHGAF
jgi:hypothetical protein